MATIQIRGVPDDVHRAYRVRAAAAGQSLQEYLLAELVEGARLQDPREIVAEVEADLVRDAAGFARRALSATRLVRADREGSGTPGTA